MSGSRFIALAVVVIVLAALVAALILVSPGRLYPWILAVHIMAVISWMAGQLYLPRLFVYHCGAEIGSVQSETFKVMERRLMRQIMNPAMIVTWAAGLWMIGIQTFADPAWLRHQGWLQVKLVLVVLMSGLHGMSARYVRDFAADRNRRTHVFYRMFNEVPTLLMVVIVILAVVKPF